MVTITLSEQTLSHLQSLPPIEGNAESKVRSLLEAEYRRQLSRYNLIDRTMRDKYKISFDDFETRKVVKERGFTWEVESDASEWELAASGIRTMQRKLKELLGNSKDENRYRSRKDFA